jgi:hypothetical protein
MPNGGLYRCGAGKKAERAEGLAKRGSGSLQLAGSSQVVTATSGWSLLLPVPLVPYFLSALIRYGFSSYQEVSIFKL